MARVVVDVMPKPEILDPQGKAVTGALRRLGFTGISVRQGKRFELEVEGELTLARMDEVQRAAETLLANPVIETFDVRVEGPDTQAPLSEEDPALGGLPELADLGVPPVGDRSAAGRGAAPDASPPAPTSMAAAPPADPPQQVVD